MEALLCGVALWSVAGEAGGAAAVGRGGQDPGPHMRSGEAHNAGHGDPVGEEGERKTITLLGWWV